MREREQEPVGCCKNNYEQDQFGSVTGMHDSGGDYDGLSFVVQILMFCDNGLFGVIVRIGVV